MTPIEGAIQDRIRRDGPITVGEYMAMALTYPEHGYYRRAERPGGSPGADLLGADPLGAEGDFITAPEICQVFGELVGIWSVVTWLQTGALKPPRLVELGPGRGTLMADALRAARTAPGFLDSVEIHLVETSPALREAQRGTLETFAPQWHETLETVPEGPAIFIANEFFDALPVEQFVRADGTWRRRLVGLESNIDTDGERLCFLVDEDYGDLPPAIASRLGDAPEGAVTEINPAARDAAASIGDRLARHGGAALIIDYGHVESAVGDTLQAVSKHRYHDPLDTPGEADLTAHVDFEALADAARAMGAVAHGPVTQREFLSRLGIETRVERLGAKARPDQLVALKLAAHRLIAPAEMGTLFKVLALGAPGATVPAGFEEEREAVSC